MKDSELYELNLNVKGANEDDLHEMIYRFMLHFRNNFHNRNMTKHHTEATDSGNYYLYDYDF